MILTFNNSFTLLYLKDDPPPSQNIESSLEEAVPGEVIAEFQRLSFQIVESGTKKGLGRPWLQLQRAFPATISCNLLAMYGSPKRQSLQGVIDGWGRGI